MARIRSLKIGFFRNEILAELDAFARLTFAGLWLLADKAGRLEDRPKRIQADLFPYESINVDAALDALMGAGFIQRYRVNDVAYIQIDRFLQHQRPHHTEAESVYPPAPKGVTKNRAPRSSHVAMPVQPPREVRDVTVKSPLENGENPLGSGSWDLGKGMGKEEEPRPPKSAALALVPNLFQRFWAAYPRRVGKQDAIKAFAKANVDETLLEAMLTAIAWQRNLYDWTKEGGRFIPHPSRWLNAKRWEDEQAEQARTESTHETVARLTGGGDIVGFAAGGGRRAGE